MEVIIVNDFCWINGGASYAAIVSARELAERGISVTFFGAVSPITAELIHPNIRCLSLDQHEILKHPHRIQAVTQGIYNRKARRTLQALLAEKDPAQTIIHVHLISKALSPAVMKLLLDSPFRVVTTLHDYSFSCPNGGFLVHPTTTICHRKPLSFSCVVCQCDSRNYAHKLWRLTRSFVQNKIWRVEDRIRFGIFPSRFTQRILEPYMPHLDISRIVLYPVHAPRLPPAQPAQGETFAFVGRFAREKGVLLLAEATRRARVPVIFIGDGDQILKESITRINPEARVTGWLPQTEITGMLRTCRALVMPSLWYETLGLVTVEAMAQGLPVIVPDNCAITEQVADGTTGLFFKQGDIEDLVLQIEKLKNPPLAASIGQAAYDWYWNDPWTVQRHVDALTRIYDEMLETRTSGTA